MKTCKTACRHMIASKSFQPLPFGAACDSDETRQSGRWRHACQHSHPADCLYAEFCHCQVQLCILYHLLRRWICRGQLEVQIHVGQLAVHAGESGLAPVHGLGCPLSVRGGCGNLGLCVGPPCIHRIPEGCVTVKVPGSTAAFPSQLWQARIRRTALCDYLTRQFAGIVSAAGGAPLILSDTFRRFCITSLTAISFLRRMR